MTKVFEYEGMTVTFEFDMKHTGHGDHNVVVTEKYQAGKYGYDGTPTTKIMTKQQAEKEMDRLIRLGYIGMN